MSFLATRGKMEMKGRIVVYSVTGCPHCKQSKATLSAMKLQFVDINLEKHPEMRQPLLEKTSKTSVPQIFFNNIHVGGNDDLQSLIQDKSRWEALLQEIIENEPPDDGLQIPSDDEEQNDDLSIDFGLKDSVNAAIINEFKFQGLIKTNRNGLFTHYNNSFSGRDLVNWLIVSKGMERKDAIETANNMLNEHFFHHVKHSQTFEDSPSIFYRLLEDEHTNALNSGQTSLNEPIAASVLSEKLRKLILSIYNKYLSHDGKYVDYAGISNSTDFKLYMDMTLELQRVDVESLSREEKLAFFINIYNALVIHINVSVSIPVNVYQRFKFFNCNHYIIGGYRYSLQDIENGILRGNKKGVGMLWPPFKENDPRLKVAMLSCEPLIHFALVCGAKSCPPIKTYSAMEVDGQLQLAAISFLESDDAVKLIPEKNEISLSKIFKWYKEDFGNNVEDVLRWVHEYMANGEKRKVLGEIIQAKGRKVTYQNYDWGINSKK